MELQRLSSARAAAVSAEPRGNKTKGTLLDHWDQSNPRRFSKEIWVETEGLVPTAEAWELSVVAMIVTGESGNPARSWICIFCIEGAVLL